MWPHSKLVPLAASSCSSACVSAGLPRYSTAPLISSSSLAPDDDRLLPGQQLFAECRPRHQTQHIGVEPPTTARVQQMKSKRVGERCEVGGHAVLGVLAEIGLGQNCPGIAQLRASGHDKAIIVAVDADLESGTCERSNAALLIERERWAMPKEIGRAGQVTWLLQRSIHCKKHTVRITTPLVDFRASRRVGICGQSISGMGARTNQHNLMELLFQG